MYFNREDYGSRIRSLRKKRGLTQEQLAEKMNVSTPYIAKIETGKQTGPVELAVEFVAVSVPITKAVRVRGRSVFPIRKPLSMPLW